MISMSKWKPTCCGLFKVRFVRQLNERNLRRSTTRKTMLVRKCLRAQSHCLTKGADRRNYGAIVFVAIMILVIMFSDILIDSTLKLLSCLSALGLLTFVGTQARRGMCGGLSILGVLLFPCAAPLDLFFVWCAAGFTFRIFIQDERLMLEGMRDLHPAGGGFSKVRHLWKYEGPHGSGIVQLFRRVDTPGVETWEPQKFVAPATAWVYYLDELQDGTTMTIDTCVTQLYRSLWIFILGLCGSVCSMCVGMLIAWLANPESRSVRLVGMCLTIPRTMVILWRWVSDLIMSNHHRGALLRGKSSPGVSTISCKLHCHLSHLDPFPDYELPDSFFEDVTATTGRQIKMFTSIVSQKMARYFQNSVIDWWADHFEVRYPSKESLVTLDVRVGDKSHKITVPKYIADGLCTGTNEHRGLTWLGVIVTVNYAALVITQFILLVSNCMSVVSGSLWIAATVAGIVGTAWLTGFPLVCSGIG
jgi:hypothetical protein